MDSVSVSLLDDRKRGRESKSSCRRQTCVNCTGRTPVIQSPASQTPAQDLQWDHEAFPASNAETLQQLPVEGGINTIHLESVMMQGYINRNNNSSLPILAPAHNSDSEQWDPFGQSARVTSFEWNLEDHHDRHDHGVDLALIGQVILILASLHKTKIAILQRTCRFAGEAAWSPLEQQGGR